MRQDVQPRPIWVSRSLRHCCGLILLGALIAPAFWARPTGVAAPGTLQSTDAQDAEFYANGRPYLEVPVEQLIEHIPELSPIHPARDQQALSMVLEKTGERVDEFLRDIVNLAAHEEVKQEKLSREKSVQASQHWEYNYLILIHRDEHPARLEEYRTDATGKPVTQRGATKGYSVTSGFALKCIYLSTAYQPESTFVYLGDGKVDQRNTYIVAFAQRPRHTTMAESVIGSWGSRSVLVQGIAWIDQESFQIVRLRTDLLGPPLLIGLTRQTTEVTFAETKLPDTKIALWLPSLVNVYAMFSGQAFRNEHRYTNYERYRVSVKVMAP